MKTFSTWRDLKPLGKDFKKTHTHINCLIFFFDVRLSEHACVCARYVCVTRVHVCVCIFYTRLVCSPNFTV